LTWRRSAHPCFALSLSNTNTVTHLSQFMFNTILHVNIMYIMIGIYANALVKQWMEFKKVCSCGVVSVCGGSEL
jgi:hypothetical protein